MSLQMQFSDPEMLCFAKYITNILVVFPKIRYMEVFDITNPRHSEQISGKSLGTSVNRGSTVNNILQGDSFRVTPGPVNCGKKVD